jgi:hypothetical protein
MRGDRRNAIFDQRNGRYYGHVGVGVVSVEKTRGVFGVVGAGLFRVGAVNRPAVFRKLTAPVKLPASVVEAAFLKANPSWEADMITITCRGHRIQEARVCLSRDLKPVPCGRDVIRDCALSDALFDPVR